MLPHGFLREAASRNATLKQQTMGGKKYQVISFTGDNKAQVNGYVNDQGIVERVETWVDNNVLGDTLFEATYSDWKDFGGVKFPTRILTKQGGYPNFELAVADVKPNVAVNIQPPQAKGKGPGGPGGPGGPQSVPEPEKLSDGVYLILGGYASIAADFKDGVYVIEGGQSEARSIAVIEQVKKLFPGRPIAKVINTHVHFDHSGGLRTYVAEGVTIVTHESNKSFYEKAFTNPSTLAPGKLEEAKKKPKIETVGDRKVYNDGNHVIELHRIRGSMHNDGMLIAYLPKEKVILEADEFNPPNPTQPVQNPSPYWQNLYDNLERLKLDYDRIIPVHYPADNRKVAKAELLRAIGKAN
jgi:glyoxylase-like metal-dependent hydrolase (beta-lactamase superfamily II)